MSIATHGVDAIRSAVIIISLIPIITGFESCQNHAVTTGGFCAVVSACIGIHRVAIITGFVVGVVLLEISSDDAIAAAGNFAVAPAAISIVFIAVIASLAALKMTVSTASLLAIGGATVGFHLIAVVAGFNPCPDHTVTTAGGGATIGTGIGRDLVFVVALLTFGSQKPIATSSLFAGG